MFIKNLNQILRNLRSRHCSCLGRLGQSCHPSHFTFQTIYIHPITFRTIWVIFNVGPFELVIRDEDALGMIGTSQPFVTITWLPGVPPLQFRNKLLVLSSWEWSVPCLT